MYTPTMYSPGHKDWLCGCTCNPSQVREADPWAAYIIRSLNNCQGSSMSTYCIHLCFHSGYGVLGLTRKHPGVLTSSHDSPLFSKGAVTHHSQFNPDDTRPGETELAQCHTDGEGCQAPVDTPHYLKDSSDCPTFS